jgi:hypothetical protein
VNKISEENIHEEESPARNASDEDFGEMQAEDLNCCVTMLGCSPVKLHGVTKGNRIGYGKRMVAQASQVVLSLPSTSLSEVLDNGSKQTWGGCNFSTLMDVKQECATPKQEVGMTPYVFE